MEHEGAANLMSEVQRVTVGLSEEQTRQLLQEVNGAYNTQINDVLLTALGQTVSEWSGSAAVLVELEGHGREEEEIGEVDVTRTVGWFTSSYPALLEVGAGADAGAVLRGVKEGLRSVPRRGLGYGMLRYLAQSDDAEWTESAAQISFNYLGQLDQVLSEDTWLQPASESHGPTRSENTKRTHLLELNGAVVGGRLTLTWSYSERQYEAATIERLAGNYIRRLQELIAHCVAVKQRGFTPSDFPLAVVGQEQIDELLARGVEIEDIYGLSPMQQGMLFHSLLEPGSGVYMEQMSCELPIAIDEQAFELTWQRLISRHTILRTSFLWAQLAQPVQVVHRHVQLPIEKVDWRGITKEEQQQRLAIYLNEERHRDFNFAEAPLMRIKLIRMSESAYQLIWTFHHSLQDGWTGPLVLNEMFSTYEMYCRGQEPEWKPGQPYRNYIAWLQRQSKEEAELYWRGQLAGVSAPTPLRLGNSGRADVTVDQSEASHHSEHQRHYSAELTEQLERYARQHQLTLNTLVQGAWALLLSRYSGTEEVVFGVTVSGRPAALAGVEEMVGLFINTLPLRVRVDAETEVGEWLAEVQERAVEMRQYEYCSLVEVQGWSEVGREQSLFESIVVFENYPVDRTLKERAGQSSAITVGQVSTVERTNYPLTIVIGPGREMWMKLSYDRTHFDEATIQRLGAQFERLLTTMVTNPQQKLAEISLLSAAEHEQAVFDWNQTAVEYGPISYVHELFELQVERTPEAIALLFEDQSVSYQDLNERANQLARYLRARGVGAEVPVAVCLPRSIELVVALWAILKAGGAYVPLDAEYPVERLNFMLADAGVGLLLTQSGLLERLPVVADLEVINLDQIGETIGVESKENLENSVSGENLAYIIYTSGSTGRPKGSMIHQYALTNRMLGLAQFFEFNQNDRMLQCLSPSFDAFGEELFPTLLSGAALVLHRDLFALTAGELLESCRKANVTTFHMAAAFWGQLVDQMVAGQLRFPESVRLFITGGESPTIERVAAVFAAAQPRLRFINAYGPTEAVVTATVYETPAESLGLLSRLPIGRPLTNTVAYLLDEQMQPVPVGFAGELYLGGVSVARGYVNGAAITAERFIPDPFSTMPGARLYRTGDLGQYLEDGAIEFLGRIDEQVKVRGHRIELAEIEAVLRQHEAVREVVVVGREDEREEFQLVAYAILHAQDAATSRTLQQYLKAKLPSYMIPSSFVLLDQLPLTPHGKIDKRALPAPEPSWMEPAEVYVAPRTTTEQLLASICAEVLGVERVGIQDNFFELGGHSLLATQFMLRAREAFQTEVPLRSLFEYPTIAELAASIEVAVGAGEGLQGLPLVARPLDEPLPLSFAQQRLWFLDQLEPNSAFYNIPAAVRVSGQLNLPALERTFTEIVRRHEALRTRFVTVDGEARQIISQPAPVAIHVTDLTEMDPALRDAEAIRLGKAEAARTFDLHAGDLLRAKVLRVTAEEHIVLLTMHHIISDGWSMNVLIKEIGTLYEAYSEGKESPLEELTIQYGDYARWQRQWMQGELLEQQLGYWREQLAELPVLEMPTDRTRPATQSYRGKRTSFIVPADVTQQLRELSQQEGATMFMVLLAAFQLLLSRYSGQEDIVVGTDIAGRSREETENLIGFFVNTLVMRTDLSGGPTFRQLVQRVREVSLGAYAHQDVPFEKLVEELQPERDLSRQPLFQVMFEVQNIFASSSSTTSQLGMSHVDVNTDTAKFDLLLALTDAPNRLGGSLEYSTDLFDGSTVERMVAHLQNLLAAIVKSSESSINELSILSEDEAQKQLYDWNKTEAEFPLASTFSVLFEAQVERNPESIAVVDRGEPFTYRELNVRTNKLASALIAVGVGPETIVALLAERGVDLLTAMIAVWKAGGAYLPLDPLYPISRIAGILQQSKTRLVLTANELHGKVEAASKELEAEKRPLIREIGQLLASGAETENPQCQYDPNNLAYVIYTSGSTGIPKGAMVEQRGMINHLFAKIKDLQIGANDRIAQTASQCFDISVWQFLSALLVGGQVYIVDDEIARDGRRLLQEVETYGLTLVETVPSLMRTMLDESTAIHKEQFSLSTVRCLVATGEALPVELCRQWLTKYPHVALMNAYGPTECSDDVTHHMIEEIPSMDVVRMPIGRPVSNMQMYILDKDRKPLPVGAVGELYVGGVGVGRGYLNDPIRTAEVFLTDPYSGIEGARLYRTGDVARYLADGRIEYVGRADEQVKVRGYRIELGEVEAVLERQAGVAECVVVARGEEGEKRLVAYVVAEAGVSLSVTELRTRLGEQLPGYMVPAAFVLLESLPLTKNGKVDRRALPEPEASQQYVAPRTATEEILAGIWQSLLKVQRVGVNDNFFELGGHSLLATQFASRYREVFQSEFSLRNLFEHPTVAELASLIIHEQPTPSEMTLSDGLIKRQKTKTADELLLELEQLDTDVSLAELF
ncbi:MAG TPA: amino acid adenylation domain-containing protein [Pyrinomonadaceae bacterium]|nr:amino acid adenylation domain-containing protein [Pyrinomonadaceae bacterium]